MPSADQIQQRYFTISGDRSSNTDLGHHSEYSALPFSGSWSVPAQLIHSPQVVQSTAQIINTMVIQA
jgi:hypothetical protein